MNWLTLRAWRRRVIARVEMRAFAVDLSAALPIVTAGLPVRIRAATAQDFPRLASVLAPVRESVHGLGTGGDLLAALEGLYRQRHLCFIAEHEDHILHFRWVRWSDASIPRLWIQAPLREGEVYGFASYTVPPARGQRLHAAVLLAMCRALRESGARTLYMWVMSGNMASLRTMPRVGAVEVGRVTQWIWRAGGRLPLSATVAVSAGAAGDHLLAPGRLVLRRPLLATRRQVVPMLDYRPVRVESS